MGVVQCPHLSANASKRIMVLRILISPMIFLRIDSDMGTVKEAKTQRSIAATGKANATLPRGSSAPTACQWSACFNRG